MIKTKRVFEIWSTYTKHKNFHIGGLHVDRSVNTLLDFDLIFFCSNQVLYLVHFRQRKLN